MLDELMKGERPAMEWWRDAVRLLREPGIQVAATGAVAANAYMPPRQTRDLNLAVSTVDLARAGRALAAGKWELLANLSLYERLTGTA